MCPDDNEMCYRSASVLASLFRGVIQNLVSVGSGSFECLFLQCQLVLWPQWVALVGERFVKGLEGSGGALVCTEMGVGRLSHMLSSGSTLQLGGICVMTHSKLSVLMSPAVQLWHWVWLCSSCVFFYRRHTAVLHMLPWHQQLLMELFVAPSSIHPNFKSWKLKQFSSDMVLYCLLILSMGLNIWIFVEWRLGVGQVNLCYVGSRFWLNFFISIF